MGAVILTPQLLIEKEESPLAPLALGGYQSSGLARSFFFYEKLLNQDDRRGIENSGIRMTVQQAVLREAAGQKDCYV